MKAQSWQWLNCVGSHLGKQVTELKWQLPVSFCLDVSFSFSKCSLYLAAHNFLLLLNDWEDWNNILTELESHKTLFNSYSFLALPLSSLRGWHASLHICWRKPVCTLQHIAIRKRKDYRGANASSTPTESGIEHSVQDTLAETMRNSAEARKAENAFKEK